MAKDTGATLHAGVLFELSGDGASCRRTTRAAHVLHCEHSGRGRHRSILSSTGKSAPTCPSALEFTKQNLLLLFDCSYRVGVGVGLIPTRPTATMPVR